MAISEVRTPRTNELNIVAGVSERGSGATAALTVVATVAAIMVDKSPRSIILKGVVIATGLKALSAVCDLAVDTISGNSMLK